MRRGLAVLDLVWHLRGSVAVEATGSDALYLDRIEQMLKQQKKPSIERGQQTIVFENPCGAITGTQIGELPQSMITENSGSRRI